MKRARRESQALKLIERLIELSPDAGLTAYAIKMRDRLALPMAHVLDKVPGETVVDRAKSLGITRQAYYAWLRGVSRPSRKQARRLEKITGFNADEIRGRPTA